MPCEFDKLQQFCNEKIPSDAHFSISKISHEKFEIFFRNINLTKATGSVNIGPRLLKIAAPFTSDRITYICNQRIITSIFPDKWKEGSYRKTITWKLTQQLQANTSSSCYIKIVRKTCTWLFSVFSFYLIQCIIKSYFEIFVLL